MNEKKGLKRVKILFKGEWIEFNIPETKPKFNPQRLYHDGIAFQQSFMDDEWERWERDATVAY
jgi:hypothetical protein